jgi:RNA polymerase sigma factor (sigma-70 family)
MDDTELLREYTASQSEAAFTQLVRRHVDLVHSVAFRRTGNRATAEEVTQTVFVLLAQKAGRLVDHPCLDAWLHRTTTNLSHRRMRSEQRRQRREAEAVAHHSIDTMAPANEEPILACLDEAMARLSGPDHTAIVTRFFLQKPMKEVGAALGTTEAAAKMRVGRALERLRIELIRRGASCSPAGLAAMLLSSSITPAPSHLAGTIAQHLAAGSAASVVPSSSIFSFLLMSSLKSKTLVGTVIVLALLGGARFWLFPEMESPDDTRSVQSPATPPFPSAELGSAGASPAVVGRRLNQPLTDDELALARRQLRDALALPLPKSGTMWPEPRVLEALERFGNRPDAAFAVLREVIDELSSISEEPDSPEAFARDLARMRAFQALGTLDRDLPGLRAYLWERQRTGPVRDQFDSFWSLKKLGFQASDAPALVETLTQANTVSLALDKQLTQAVRDLGLAHPEALKPYMSAILGLLDHPESRIQLRAAATLIGWPEGNDPRVLERLRHALGASDFEALVAIAAARAGGERARPLIPDLLRYAETAEERGLRGDSALHAVAQIRPDLGETHPDIAALQARTAESERIRSRMQSPTRTFEDLVAGLRDPASAVTAANALADWGPSAIDTLSGMRAALAGMDEDSRDRVVEAMRRIDPAVQVERIPFDTVFSGVVHATSVLPRSTTDAASRRASEMVDEYQMFRTWRTPEELVSLVGQLSTDANPVAEAFLLGIAEKDPELATRLRRAAGSSGR